MVIPLPPEIVEIIVKYLPDTRYHLRLAALISRTWVIPCQRALFRRLDPRDFPVARLRTHLHRYPHLQDHIRHIVMTQTDRDECDISSKGHLVTLASMFLLMPNLTSLKISLERYRPWRTDDVSFFKAFAAFLRGTPTLVAIDICGLRNQLDIQQMFLYLENTTIKRVGLELNGYDKPTNVFTSALAVVRLPQIESICFQVWSTCDIMEGLKLWFPAHRTMFPGLKDLEIRATNIDDFNLWFRDVLQPISTLRLESLRMGFDGSPPTARNVPLALFDGLHFDHLKFGVYRLDISGTFEVSCLQNFYIWLSSIFRLLTADSAHFIELTFAVVKTFGGSAMWDALDDALSLEAFYGVKHVHFETREDRVVITDLEYPDLVPKIRSALPRLDSRGVLCFS